MLGLQELLSAAQHVSYDVASAQHRIEAAEAQLSEARISPFFQFTMEAGFAWVPDATGVAGYSNDSRNQLERGFGPAIQGKVKGAIPLWTFGKLDAARTAASAGVQAAKADLRRVQNKVSFDVRRAYYGLQLALDVQQMISEGLPKLESAQESMEDRLANGDDADLEPVDGYRLATAVVEIQARASEATMAERSARYALQILTGNDQLRVPDCPIEPLQYAIKPIAHYLGLARAGRPELAMLKAATVAKGADLAAKRARFFPDLALGLEAEGTHIPGQTAYEHYRPYYVGAAIVARWNLDFWGHHQRAQKTEQEALALSSQRQLAEKGVELEIETRYEALADAQRRMAAWAKGHRTARRWFVSSAQGFEVGTVSAKELIDGISAYFKARYAHLQAIHDHNIAVAALEQAVNAPLLASDQWEDRCDLPAPLDPSH